MPSSIDIYVTIAKKFLEMWAVFKGQTVQEGNRRLTGTKIRDNKRSKEGCLLQLAFGKKTNGDTSYTQTWRSFELHRAVECLPLPKAESYLGKQLVGEGTKLTSCLKQQHYRVSSLPAGIMKLKILSPKENKSLLPRQDGLLPHEELLRTSSSPCKTGQVHRETTA